MTITTNFERQTNGSTAAPSPMIIKWRILVLYATKFYLRRFYLMTLSCLCASQRFICAEANNIFRNT